MMSKEIETFIQFAKEHFRIDVVFKPSDSPDTFETFFNASFMKNNELIADIAKLQYENSATAIRFNKNSVGEGTNNLAMLAA